ncbi:MAG: hypothetical protein QXK08_02610 [Candidatus Woesearchaeota archaeon]
MEANKLVALAVIALFVVSIAPFAAAQGAGGPQYQGGDENAVVGEAEQTAEQGDTFERSREQLKVRAEQMREELRQKREQVRAEVEGKKKSLQERYQAMKEERKELREERRTLHQQWKEKRSELKADREAARAEIGQVREQVRTCKGSTDAECEKARIRAKVAAGKFLTKSAEHIIALLEKAKERVEASALGDAEKQERLAAIDAVLADVDAAQETVASLGENATKNDLKEATQIIRDVWGRARKEIKKGVGAVASARIGGILVKMEKLSAKFDRVIEKLQAKGKDVSNANAKKAEFQAKLDAAKALQAEAKALFESGNHDAAAQKIQAAHAELKAANEMLRGIVQEIRGIGGEAELEQESKPAEAPEATGG